MYALPQRFAGGLEERVDTDAAIRQTDTDAAVARFSAVQKGYLYDPYLKHLLPRGAQFQPPRPPLINVGTHVRSHGIDKLVDKWLALCERDEKRCQIVSLGAGSDTRFWRIASGSHRGTISSYIELDFPENTTKKAIAIRRSKPLYELLGSPQDTYITHGGSGLTSPIYHLLPADLRLPPAESLAIMLQLNTPGAAPLLDPSVPTLLPTWFVDLFEQSGQSTILGGIVYEMFGLTDAFGKVMLSNLKHSRALTLREYRGNVMGPPELERVMELEMLDEMEELELVLRHYAFTWGYRTFGPEEQRLDWSVWRLRPFGVE
ncbi:carboxy methyl transferase for protein phosphatase 2A [Steccherinum ochraceum]|uniref:Leucine carboxyl methyltransferase 1 n=1 Tax=Steccherinum ochraceum TaxID=92696 RepID=A0A4R0R3X6_9APHY|nr:carboxy methyl transferase for protein phosphatase 2A [Steccherinum ochraceum]